jgi:hypothetical protein
MEKKSWPEDPRSPKAEMERGIMVIGHHDDVSGIMLSKLKLELALLKARAGRPHICIVSNIDDFMQHEPKPIPIEPLVIKNTMPEFEEPTLTVLNLRNSDKVSPREQRRREKYRRK